MDNKWLCGIALAAALNFSTVEAAYVPPKVPEDIYQWVQSSERMNYFFNKKELCYGLDKDGHVDLDTLIVPVIKTYDFVQIEDLRMKRSWRMEPTEVLSDLAGEANYLRFSISRGVVTVTRIDLLDSHFSTIESSEPNREIVLDTLTEKSRDGIFYRAILDYEKDHRRDILSHTKGELTPEAKKKFEKEEKRHEKELKEREKQLEKERREKEKHEE